MSRFIRSAVIRNKARKEALKREQIDKRYTKTVGMIQYIKPNPLTVEERKKFEEEWIDRVNGPQAIILDPSEIKNLNDSIYKGFLKTDHIPCPTKDIFNKVISLNPHNGLTEKNWDHFKEHTHYIPNYYNCEGAICSTQMLRKKDNIIDINTLENE